MWGTPGSLSAHASSSSPTVIVDGVFLPLMDEEESVNERDRDSAGRPRNARPRDGLGRPLPRDATGDVRVPDDLVLPPALSLIESQRWLDAGMPFHAHEVLEGTWKSAPEAERDLWQGLAQLAVGFTHLLRGNPIGAAALLRRGRDLIAPYAGEPPHEVDVPGLLAWVGALLDRLGDPPSAAAVPDQPAPPQLRRQ